MLNEFVRLVLCESAKTIQDAISDELALAISRGSSGTTLVLYRPAKVKRLKDIEVLGMIQVLTDKATESRSVKMSHAVKGYGPTMYDIAMNTLGPIKPDDPGKTSAQASNVWRTYFNSREDVQKRPIRNDDDQDFLNQVFSVKVKQNTNDLLARNMIFKMDHPELSNVFDDELAMIAINRFKKVYGGMNVNDKRGILAPVIKRTAK